jgi:hypothetical protein
MRPACRYEKVIFMVKVPNFLLIGPPKCGTTALYPALTRHPQVYGSPVKEPYFFAFDGQIPAFAGPGARLYRNMAVTTWEAYLAFFAAATDEFALGEGSPLYLTSYQPERTAANIRRRLPDVRLIAVLRQPAERAYSQFTYRRQQGFEPLADFRQALDAEERRIAANWPPACRYWHNSYYFTTLSPYFALFPHSQIRIDLYDDMIARPQTLLADLCAFLDIDPSLRPPQIERINETAWPRSRLVRFVQRRMRVLGLLLPSRLRTWNRITPPPLSPALRRELTESYREEIDHLQVLIGRDLSHWLKEPAAKGAGTS